jgi:hypothetical protein
MEASTAFDVGSHREGSTLLQMGVVEGGKRSAASPGSAEVFPTLPAEIVEGAAVKVLLVCRVRK